MKQCKTCGNSLADDASFCNVCGALCVENQAQQYFSQQLLEQQRMINNMMEQQQQMNRRMAQNQQQQYIYVPMKTPASLAITNPFALVAAVVCLVSMFTDILLGSTLIDLSSACSRLKDYAEGWELFALIMVMMFPWIVGALTVSLIISSFTTNLKVLNDLLLSAHIISFFCFFAILVEIYPEIEPGDFSAGFWILIVGFFMGCISLHTNSKPKDTSVYAPRRNLGNGVSNTNARSVEEISQDSDVARWICPRCYTKNTGAICKVCGMPRK